MNYGLIMAAALLAVAPTPNAPDIAAGVAPVSNLAASVVPPSATLDVPAAPSVGERAPDFAYQSHDYLWRNLHNMLEQGNVLLVFGADDEQLRSLERDQEELLGRGIIPVAVVGQKESEVWRTVSRDALTYSLLSDPHATIAEQYGAVDSSTPNRRAVWFVIDHSGRVRGTGEGASIPRNWTALAGAALGASDVHNTGTR